MNIERAKTLKRGDRVRLPEDRGTSAHGGAVVSVGTIESETPNGTRYIWVTVRGDNLREAVWPSNRIN